MKKVLTAIAIAAAIGIAFTGCAKKAAASAATQTKVSYAVTTETVHTGTLDDYLQFGGSVTAVNTVTVMPTAAGHIYSVAVKVGDKVAKNQLLLQVDPSVPGMTYAKSPVRAPIAGTVTMLPYGVGSMVAQSMAVAQIATTNDLEVDINVAERYVSRVKLGQKAELTFDAYPGETFQAEVTEVAPSLEATSRTMAVTLSKIKNTNNEIKIGMYARVKLITDVMNNIIIMPADAMVTREGKTYAFVVDTANNIAHQIEITPGLTVDNLMEVKAGLQDGDEVVVSGQTLLSEGSSINIVNTSGSSDTGTTNGGSN
jgi:multidrug efflux pump subunit AcrA (membrane-fusion protein)